jgi:hypothetical protein
MHVTKLSKCIGATLLTLSVFANTTQAQNKNTKATSIVAPKEATEAMPQWAVSFNAGIAIPYTDVKDKGTAPVIGIGAAYFATPYLHIHLDVQKGWLKGGGSIGNGSDVMGTDNSYFTTSITACFLPLGLMNDAQNKSKGLDLLSGIYGGIGLGFISNSVSSNDVTTVEYGSIGSYKGVSLMMPIEAGINIPVLLMTKNRRLLVNANVRTNLCFSDKIDGYVPIVPSNKKNDAFDTFTLGLVYNF